MAMNINQRCRCSRPNIHNSLCRANCPVVLSCAVCFCYRCYVLIGSTGVICVGEKTGGREISNTCRKRKKEKSSTQQHVLYPVLLCVRKKAHSAARHSTAAKDTAPHGMAPHGATLRCWAIYSRTDLSWACIVIQQRST